MARTIKLTSDLGDALLFASLQADESLGRPFSFNLRATSRNAKVDLQALLGKPMTVTVTLDDGLKRYFNGIVAEAEQISFESLDDKRHAEYAFHLVPKPWLQTRRADCRIYKNASVVDIIKKVLNEVGYSDVKLSLTGTYPKREYCVQYRETYFNFLSRLMEQEGIYYYFEHTASTHTMVLADGTTGHAKPAKFGELPWLPGDASQRHAGPAVTDWKTSRSVQTTKYVLNDYDPMKPKASLMAPEKIGNPADVHTVAGLEVFDYPGDHEVVADGKRYAKVRVEALNVPQAIFQGATNSLTLTSGALFKLKEFPIAALNQDYLVVSTSTHCQESAETSGGGSNESYRCRFEVIPSKQPFRAAQVTPKPSVIGLQTAVVCGTKDSVAEDIVVDSNARIQVIFHWAKADRANHDISCPVRVASAWAGKQWGMIHIPRVGQEVVVSFLEGDPDRPLIIGSVYNADHMPPYALPANMTQSGIKSRSHKGGGAANFNEFRFEDKKGEEEVYLHAEKDLREMVENDHFVEVGHDETELIKHDRMHTVDHDETVLIKHDRTHTVENDETFTIKVNRTHDIGKEDTLSVGANATTDVKQKYKLTAGTEIELVTGASSITMTAGGDITIKGVNVKIEGSVNVEAKAGVGFKASGGATMEVTGGASGTVKAPMLNLTGDGIASLSGGLVKIG